MTESLARASALLLAATITAGNVAATQALAHHQVAVAEAAAIANASSSPRRVAENGASVAFMKAMWR
jgi:hypothetical protein